MSDHQRWGERGSGKSESSNGQRRRREQIRFPSSLDFERVINQYSIQALHDRFVHSTSSIGSDEKHSHEKRQLLERQSSTGNTVDPDYNTFDGSVFVRHHEPVPSPPPPNTQGKVLKLGKRGTTLIRWVLSILTGLLTGLISIFIVSLTDTVQTWRSNLLDQFWQKQQAAHILLLNHQSYAYLWSSPSSYALFLIYALTNISFAMLSALLCLYLAPEAIGSGIPEVKAYLNGVRVKRFTSMRLFFVKIVGTIASVSSGLAVGPEGPLVHIGAILGSSCSKISNLILRIFPDNSLFLMNEDLWYFVTSELSHFSTDAERRDLVSIGAAAGFAAAFGAPIGGLLFSMEEASSYFDHTLFLRTLSATAIATFCLAVHHGNLSEYSIISLGSFATPDENIFLNRVEEFPLYILIAVIGGILGGFFCRAWKSIQTFRKRKFLNARSPNAWKLIEVALLSILTSALTYFLPSLPCFCRFVTQDDDLVNDDATNTHRFHAHQFDCSPGYINELADIVFGSREDAISAILTAPAQFSAWTLLTVGLMFFPLMLLTLGVSLPSGIFMPTVLIGSSLGGAAGLLFQHWISSELSPSTFALLGAAALLAGIQRSTVSLCVILVEGTGQVKVLIPVIVTVVVAQYVAELVCRHGLYEISMEVNRYPFLEHNEMKHYDIIQVSQVMSTPPVTLGPRERAQTIVRILRETDHHGFPIVCPLTNKFMGLVRRDQLVALLEYNVFDKGTESSNEDHENGDNNDDSSFDMAQSPGKWTPKTGVGNSRLMNLAYHINDDQYAFAEFDVRGSVSSDTWSRRVARESEDEFDTYSWLVSIRKSLASMPPIDNRMRRPNSRTSLLFGDISLPPLTPSQVTLEEVETRSDGDMHQHDKGHLTSEFATVATNRKGNVYIRWLNPLHMNKWVNIAAVMNRGTYTVTEFCPLSKAHFLFTALGLRHLIVLGGESGGSVVGIITRINLLKNSVEDRTGYSIQ
jgi:chloride channel 7